MGAEERSKGITRLHTATGEGRGGNRRGKAEAYPDEKHTGQVAVTAPSKTQQMGFAVFSDGTTTRVRAMQAHRRQHQSSVGGQNAVAALRVSTRPTVPPHP